MKLLSTPNRAANQASPQYSGGVSLASGGSSIFDDIPVSVVLDGLASGNVNADRVDFASQTYRPRGEVRHNALPPDMSVSTAARLAAANAAPGVGSWLSSFARSAAPILSAVVPGAGAVTNALWPTQQPQAQPQPVALAPQVIVQQPEPQQAEWVKPVAIGLGVLGVLAIGFAVVRKS